MTTRSKTMVYLLGGSVTELTGSKLPSLRMALGLFLHYHTELSLTVRESSAATIRGIAEFWMKARIPMRDAQNCQIKLEKVFEEWRLLKKNKGRQSASQRAREEIFSSKLDDLFDIAHAEALTIMTIEEDKEFLIAQREKGRRGVMAGLDTVLIAKEKRAAERRHVEIAKRQKADEHRERENATVVLESSGTSSPSEEEGVLENKGAVGGRVLRKRGKKNLLTLSLDAALDRTKLSDRKAAFVIAESIKSAVGNDINDFILNRSSIRRSREMHRADESSRFKEQFQVNLGHALLVVHWDGKLLQDLTGREKVDRLPVLVSGKELCRLLTVAKLSTGAGEAQAEAVHAALIDWGIADNVRAMCFDTTSSNTGRSIGACILLEQKLGKELLALACRHHVMELIIGTVFQICMGKTSAPEVLLFKKFQTQWQNIDRKKYKTGIQNDEVLNSIQDVKCHILEFANKQLEDCQPRDDYQEFMELAVIFLGGTPVRGIRFMAPGAMHHARWMSKVIYSLKVWMFRDQFNLTPRVERGLRDICVFAVRVYLIAWMTAPLTSHAPYNDFTLLNTFLDYSTIHADISRAASKKLASHLWYLSEDLVALALFDNRVSTETKRHMVMAMRHMEGEDDPPRRCIVALDTFRQKKLEDFVTKRSSVLFQRMELQDGFLDVDPEFWENNEDFQQALQTVRAMTVVNDHSERGVALIQEFSGILTRNEHQLQFLLKVVAQHRKMYPDSHKKTLMNPEQE